MTRIEIISLPSQHMILDSSTMQSRYQKSLVPIEGNSNFSLLMGIHNELKEILVKRKFKTSEYIPYGDQWLPYSIRRIRERKRNILLLARSILQP